MNYRPHTFDISLSTAEREVVKNVIRRHLEPVLFSCTEYSNVISNLRLLEIYNDIQTGAISIIATIIDIRNLRQIISEHIDYIPASDNSIANRILHNLTDILNIYD